MNISTVFRVAPSMVRPLSTGLKKPAPTLNTSFNATESIRDITPIKSYTPNFLLVEVKPKNQPASPWLILGYTGHTKENASNILQSGLDRPTFATLHYEHALGHAGNNGTILTIAIKLDTYLKNLSEERNINYSIDEVTNDPKKFENACAAGLGFTAQEYASVAANDFMFYKPVRTAIIKSAEVIDTKDPSAPVNTDTDRVIFNNLWQSQISGASDSIFVKWGLVTPETLLRTFGRLSLPNNTEK